jgi:6,7-dimethyl-8-ribityllumazine synthase
MLTFTKRHEGSNSEWKVLIVNGRFNNNIAKLFE